MYSAAIVRIMAGSIHHHPLAIEQRTQLEWEVNVVQEGLQNSSILMHRCYGDDSQAAIRADEVDAAL
jgi:hypothetical protein